MRGQLALFTWLLCVHAGALVLFTTGFFLTRFEVPDVSECTVLPNTEASVHLRRHDDDIERAAHDSTANNGARDGCWMPQRYKRVVFVVIDALRYDFVANASTSTAAAGGDTAPSFYLNHLPVFRNVLARAPRQALLLKFVADPPTMTMQRLKGLTTGSLPTFLDIKDNMASAAIAEDNLIRQMRAHARPVVFMGDDTWDGLYAQHFTRKYAFDSFNVKDLDSVDRGVERHLFPELARADWGLLIAHFLGVDHVGHTHGPSSPFMTKKLREMDAVMTKLVDAIDDDTLLAVMGDHGMSADGNHGGASDDETGAALFLYSKRQLVRDASASSEDPTPEWPSEVPQVDLVPTLALLSGLPIPFGNLGSVIPQLFFTATSPVAEDQQSDRVAAFETLNRALALNVDQVRRYLFRYSRASKLPERAYDALERVFADITRLREELHMRPADADAAVRHHTELAALQQTFLREALSLGRSLWTQFDFCNMVWGVLFLLWSLALIVVRGVFCASSHDKSARGDFPVQTSAVGALVGYFGSVLATALPVLPTAAFSRALVLALLFGLVDTTARIRLQPPRRSIMELSQAFGDSIDAPSVAAAAVVLLHVLALLSNSYIVAEAKVMTFLSVTVGFALLFQCQRNVLERRRRVAAVASSLVLIASTRLASALDPPNIIQSDVSLLRTFVPLALTVALAYGAVVAFTGASPLASPSKRMRCAFASVVTSCAACGAFWSLSPIESTLVRLWLPRSVLFTALGGLVLPLLPRVGSRRLKTNASSDAASVRERLVRPTRVLLVFQVAPAFMLVLGPTSPLSAVLLLLQSLSLSAFAVLCHRSRHHDVSLSWPLLWSTVCYHAFFFTGHENTFTSLQNAAGFVGFDDFRFYIAGALLGLNTFGSYLVSLLCLPLPLLVVQESQSRPSLAASPAALGDDRGGPSAMSPSHSDTRSVSELLRSRWWRTAFTVASYFALNATVSTVFVALQRRHLMVWAIFAPKFIFDAIALVVLESLLVLVSVVSV